MVRGTPVVGALRPVRTSVLHRTAPRPDLDSTSARVKHTLFYTHTHIHTRTRTHVHLQRAQTRTRTRTQRERERETHACTCTKPRAYVRPRATQAHPPTPTYIHTHVHTHTPTHIYGTHWCASADPRARARAHASTHAHGTARGRAHHSSVCGHDTRPSVRPSSARVGGRGYEAALSAASVPTPPLARRRSPMISGTRACGRVALVPLHASARLRAFRGVVDHGEQ